MSFATVNKSSDRLDSNSGWNVKPGKETDTAIVRYNRVAMLETILAIRERKRHFVRWTASAILLLAGVLVITAGILGWLS
ncbi:MAG: hypothetical protein O2856_20310 [Planctomycetota bacterium]|nr:hypothetical protein [Planctomycetota bacterium]